MGRSIEDIIQGLRETYVICRSVYAYDRKKYIDAAIDRLNKYQMLKADYENRLKADMVAMLTELQLEIEEIKIDNNVPSGFEPVSKTSAFYEGVSASSKVIQEKINSLKGDQEGEE